MANKKTSEENALAKSGITLNTAIRLADGSTGDNYQISLFDLADVITLTSADAITLLSTPNAIMQGSDYKITSLGITGVSYVIISGRDMVIGKGEGKAYVSGIGQLTKCTYDVVNNDLSGKVIVWAGDVSQSGSDDPSIDRTHVNLLGSDVSFTRDSPGSYRCILPIAILSSDNFIAYSSVVNIVDGNTMYSVFASSTRADIFTGIILAELQDNVLNNTYIEISISL